MDPRRRQRKTASPFSYSQARSLPYCKSRSEQDRKAHGILSCGMLNPRMSFDSMKVRRISLKKSEQVRIYSVHLSLPSHERFRLVLDDKSLRHPTTTFQLRKIESLDCCVAEGIYWTQHWRMVLQICCGGPVQGSNVLRAGIDERSWAGRKYSSDVMYSIMLCLTTWSSPGIAGHGMHRTLQVFVRHSITAKIQSKKYENIALRQHGNLYRWLLTG